MKPKTELFLYQCLWVADSLLRPTWRNLSGTFEEWSYRGGLMRQIRTLEAQEWIESRNSDTGRVIRLTEKGVLKAIGGQNPETRWNRAWDGLWRIVVFDLPEKQRALRNELRRQLRRAHFGCLQASVWITPDPVDDFCRTIRSAFPDCGVMTFLEAVPCGGEEAGDIVRSAWSFERVNHLFELHIQHLDNLPSGQGAKAASDLLAWGKAEKALWDACIREDPLLPEVLLPANYAGVRAWKKRQTTLRKAGKLALSIHTKQ